MVAERDRRTFVERLNAAISDGEGQVAPAEELMREYLANYDGAHFHDYDVVDSPAAQITAGDLVAVTFLSMEIRRGTKSGFTPHHARQLEASGPRIAALLSQIPTTRELHTLSEVEYEQWIGSSSPAERLWRHLRDDIKLPRVATYKLLARKRPHLLPIRDSAGDRALTNRAPWWRPWWVALSENSSTVERLTMLRHRTGAVDLSLLRVADIVIWMRFKK